MTPSISASPLRLVIGASRLQRCDFAASGELALARTAFGALNCGEAGRRLFYASRGTPGMRIHVEAHGMLASRQLS
jgi:hypothetical protein